MGASHSRDKEHNAGIDAWQVSTQNSRMNTGIWMIVAVWVAMAFAIWLYARHERERRAAKRILRETNPPESLDANVAAYRERRWQAEHAVKPSAPPLPLGKTPSAPPLSSLRNWRHRPVPVHM